MSPYGNFHLARQELKKVHSKHSDYKLLKEMGNHFRENMIIDEVIWYTDISHTLLCEWNVGDWLQWTITKGCRSSELVQNKFLKWLLRVNKYCNSNASRAETGRFPMRIEAQCRNFKLWLTLTKTKSKLSQIACNDIKWNENTAFWSKKIKSLLEQIRLGEFWMKAHYICGHRNRKHDQTTT